MKAVHSTGVWARRLEGEARTEYLALQAERDPEIYHHSLWVLGFRMEARGDARAAADIYAEIAAQAPSTELQSKARDRLAALSGQASSFESEVVLGRLAQQATDPVAIAAMSAGGLAFRIGRFATLNRLLASPSAGLLRTAAPAIGGLGGLLAEAPVFAATNLLGRRLLPHSNSLESSFGENLASSLITLGAMRLTGFAGSRLAAGRSAPMIHLTQQASLLGGAYLGQGLSNAIHGRETHFGFIDALGTWMQFQVGGRIVAGLNDGRLSSLENSIDRAANRLLQNRPGIQAWQAVEATSGKRLTVPMHAPKLPTSFAMSMDNDGAGTFIPHERGGAVVPPQAKIDYPKEIDALLKRAEEIMRAPDYLQGGRKDLLRKRVPIEIVEQIWFHQHMSVFEQLPWLKIKDGSVESILTEPLYYQKATAGPNPDLIDLALLALRRSRNKSALAQRVIEVRGPTAMLEQLLDAEPFSPASSILSFSSTVGAQEVLQNQLHLFSRDGDEFVARVTSLSFLEKIYQCAFGEDSIQFHFVDGSIPRKQTMRLRRDKVAPVAVARHQLILGDLLAMKEMMEKAYIYPAHFGAHDAYFHAARDAQADAQAYRDAGKIFDFVESLPEDFPKDDREPILDGLSDGDLRDQKSISDSILTGKLLHLQRKALASVRLEANPYRRRVRIRELQEISDLFAPYVKRAIPKNPDDFLLRKQRDRFFSDRAAIEQMHRDRSIHYTEAMRPAVASIERTKQQRGYLEGTREELLAKRVDMRLADQLWFYQAMDFAGRVPEVQLAETDASILLFIDPQSPRESEPDAALLKAALDSLDAETTSREHHRVLELSFPLRRLYLEKKNPLEHYLGSMPFAVYLEEYLDRRVRLIDGHRKLVRMRIPSLSLIERLAQLVHGGDGTQFHFVSGEIPESDAIRIRAKSANVVGLSAYPLFFSEHGGKIHPFTFTGHDAFEHAVGEARISSSLRAFAGELYLAVQDHVTDGSLKTKLLNDIANFNSLTGSDAREVARDWFLRLVESVDHSEAAYHFLGEALRLGKQADLPALSSPEFQGPLAERRKQIARSLKSGSSVP